ncbi:hypothetical protein CFP56_015713 [Quercus suber]|uniref:Uncharacterized protein n=1 Tax=Quercus suber TaxID=58331 RepID=A0AAW0KS52_QUESU
MCPPKTCVLLESLDEKSMNNVADGWQMPITTHFQSANKLVFTKGRQYPMWPSTKTPWWQFTINRQHSMWKEPKSVIHRGKHLDENTLKKELWTKFEVASTP